MPVNPAFRAPVTGYTWRKANEFPWLLLLLVRAVCNHRVVYSVVCGLNTPQAPSPGSGGCNTGPGLLYGFLAKTRLDLSNPHY